MKILNKIIIALVVFVFVISAGCSNSEPSNKFSVLKDNPATGVTFGWYVPDTILQNLIGPNFSPEIVNDKNEGLLMFFVAMSNNHRVGGQNSGKLAMAQLLVPVIKMSGLNENAGDEIENVLVSPLTILDEGKPYYNNINQLGFSIVKGKIELTTKVVGEKIEIESIITTSVGKTILKAQFENLPIDTKHITAVINPGSSSLKYFRGEERAQRYENGKGYVKSEGNTFYSGLSLVDRPYFITLDKEFVWDFYFEGN